MAGVLTPALQMSASRLTRRRRELPVPGELLVQKGDKVSADQIVARAFLPGDLNIIRLPETMGLQVFEVLQGMKCKVGDSVKKGDLLCEHAGLFGLFRSKAISPVSGDIEFITERTGHVGIRQAAIPIDLKAYISGTVVEIDPEKSVTIETSGTFVQGIFGIGGERTGSIEIIAAADAVLTVAAIPADCSGKILVGGMHPDKEVLRTIAERGGIGLITGSMDDTFIADYLGYDLGIALTGDEDVPATIIMTEGFGSLPMSQRAYGLLSDCAGKEASINGATQVRAGAVRPEIIVPGSSEATETTASQTLEIGSNIRLIRVPYFGQRATVTELPAEAQQIETGAKTRILKAKLESGAEVIVPRANVELV